MSKLFKDEKDLTVIAQYFVKNGGCKGLHCVQCPCYVLNGISVSYSCAIDSCKNDPLQAVVTTKQWAINYLEQIKKLEFLEKLK